MEFQGLGPGLGVLDWNFGLDWDHGCLDWYVGCLDCYLGSWLGTLQSWIGIWGAGLGSWGLELISGVLDWDCPVLDWVLDVWISDPGGSMGASRLTSGSSPAAHAPPPLSANIIKAFGPLIND